MASTIVVLAWGVLAFGAVRPWAYWPLYGAAALLGSWWVCAPRRRSAPALEPSVIVATMVLVAAAALQLVSVPVELLQRISPGSTAFLTEYHTAFAGGLISRHPIAVDPRAAWAGVAGLAAMVLWFLGHVKMLQKHGAARVTAGVAILGVIVALVGIIQRPLFTGKIYGFWAPNFPGQPFGPFVNRNHFAGWMLMAVPLTVAYACGRIDATALGGKANWRQRLLWLGSEHGSRVVLAGIAAALMGLSVLLSVSRSGVVCFAGGMLVLAAVGLRRRASGRLLRAGFLAALMVVAVSWARVDLIVQRFGPDLGGRPGAWLDAVEIARRFMPFGSGLNTYGVTTTLYQTYDRSVHYAQAHNDYLELAAEGGLLVGIPAAVLALVCVTAVRRRFVEALDDPMTWWLRVGALTGIVAIALQEIGDFSLQMPGNMALFAVLAAIAVHRPPARTLRRAVSQAA